MALAQPFGLLGLGAVLLAAVAFWRAMRRRQDYLRLMGQRAAEAQKRAVQQRRLQGVIWLLGLAVLALALTQPQWGRTTRPNPPDTPQIMIVLDVSDSMSAVEEEGSRFQQAMAIITGLLQAPELASVQIGVVLFAGRSELYVPLTLDRETAVHALQQTSPGLLQPTGTDIGQALDNAVTSFDVLASGARTIILLSDGEDHEGEALSAAGRAAVHDITLITVGLGSPINTLIPLADVSDNGGQFKRNADGTLVVTKLNENLLREVAEAGNGRYFTANQLNDDLAVLQKYLIEAAPQQTHLFTAVLQERFQLFLAVALLLLLSAEFLPVAIAKFALPQRKLTFPFRAWLVGFVLLFLTTCQANNSIERYVVTGNQAFASGDYALAQAQYQLAQTIAPDSAELYYNQANAFYRQADYRSAQEQIQKALPVAADSLREAAYFNLGNSYFQLAEYETAVRAYQETLRLNPDNADAKHNLELAIQLASEESGASSGPAEITHGPEAPTLPDHAGMPAPIPPEETSEDRTHPPLPTQEEADTAEFVMPERGQADLLETAGEAAGVLPPELLATDYPVTRPSKDW